MHSISQSNEDTDCYAFIHNKDSLWLNVNKRSGHWNGPHHTDDTSTKPALHQLTWVLDPRDTQSEWYKEGIDKLASGATEAHAKIEQYITTCRINDDAGLVSRCKQAVLTDLLAAKQWRGYPPQQAVDGALAFVDLPRRYSVQSPHVGFVIAAGDHIFIAIYKERKLSMYAHLPWDRDIVSLKSLFYHDAINLLQPLQYTERRKSIHIVNFDDSFLCESQHTHVHMAQSNSAGIQNYKHFVHYPIYPLKAM
tara:strand:+ start:333 stop:1085 length:753 start_codon:yes stop_codon:yes gene_type:complete